MKKTSNGSGQWQITNLWNGYDQTVLHIGYAENPDQANQR
jgi:hypothetical protein